MGEAAFTARQLALLGLPDLPATESGVIRLARSQQWPAIERKGRGGGKAYPIASLPEPVKAAVLRHLLASAPAPVPAPAAPPPDAASLKAYQRDIMEARAALLGEVDRLMLLGSSRGKAVEAVVAAAKAGALRPELQRLVAVANARSSAAGRNAGLSRASLYNWLAERERAAGAGVNHPALALAPKAAPEAGIPAWAAAMMALYGRPAKPALTNVVAALAEPGALPGGVAPPSYDQARNFLRRVDAVTRNHGRMGPRALKQLRAYVTRDVSELWPGAVFVGDGHTFKAEVAHPIHGRPFRPEVTAIVDVYTRRVVGWSAALAENTWAVADALRHAVTTCTTPDIWYYDNGSGANNKAWDDDCAGMLARMWITKMNSAPWSSQARGAIERLNRSLWHPLAKRSPTYVGQDMDDEARQRAFKVTRKEIALAGRSRLLTPWAEFLTICDAAVAAYNDRPHDGLAKIIDPETGKRRSRTPNEAWRAAVDAGWTPDPVSEADAVDLFRPAVRRRVQRGRVAIFGNQYSHDALEAMHGEDALVGYDIHDAGRVWIARLDGRHVCVATWDHHRTSYVPVSMAEQAREKRVAGKIRRLDAHRETAEAELSPPVFLEHMPAASMAMPMAMPMPMAMVARAEDLAEAGAAIDGMIGAGVMAVAPADPAARPRFADDVEWVSWLLANPDRVTDADRKGLRETMRSPAFRLELELNGLAPTSLLALTEAA